MKNHLFIVVFACLALNLALVCGCREEPTPVSEATPPAVEQKPTPRAEDPAYHAALAERQTQKKAIQSKIAAMSERLQAAKAAGASESEIARLNAEGEKLAAELTAHEAESREFIRARIAAENKMTNENQLQKKGK